MDTFYCNAPSCPKVHDEANSPLKAHIVIGVITLQPKKALTMHNGRVAI
jgi:hypothetical protein